MERLAEQLEAWLGNLRRFLDACQISLHPRSMPDDLLGSLHRLDGLLERIRFAERSLKRHLRREAPPIAARLQQATGQAFHLRNLVTSFFIRWRAFQEAERAGGPAAFLDRREMEETLLDANRAARELATELDDLDPVLRGALAPLLGRSDVGPAPRR